MTPSNKLQFFLKVFLITIFISWSCEKRPIESTVTVPELTTSDVNEITGTTARCGGTIIFNGGTTVISRGVCWSTNNTSTVDDNKTIDENDIGTSNFTSFITGLDDNTTYYVRAYGTNRAGTGYGSTMSFTTLQRERGTVTDIDGNTYQTIKIGNQWWMEENLKVIHYRNGDTIPNVINDTTWANLTTSAYCNYDNHEDSVSTYGRLYNLLAVQDTRNISPQGWHVPSESEWQNLIDYLGGSNIAGGKMKETGTNHWLYPNTGATNESGFTALSTGMRHFQGGFYNKGYSSHFWSSTGWYYYLIHDDSQVHRQQNWYTPGFSVRCVSD